MLGTAPLSTYAISDQALGSTNSPPTVALDTADASSTSDTTPELLFTGTDSNGDDIRYEVQIDTVNTFDSNPGSGSATVVQTKAANGGGYVVSPTIQFTSNTTTGNTIIISVTYNDDVAGVISSITDTTGNTYAKIAGGASGGDTTTELWYAYNITGGTTPTATVTMTVPANSHDFSINMREVSGLTTTDPFDVKAEGATTAGTTHTSPSTGTTNQSDEFVYGCMGLAANSTFSAGAGYSDLTQVNGSDIFQASASESKTVSSTGTQSASFTSSASTVGYVIVATFKIAVTAATPLIDAVSGTDAGFADITNGADTDPFASGDQIGYTVQSALTTGVTYYWRVRGKDPSGSNTWGSWATTRSFTVSSAVAISPNNAAWTFTTGTDTITQNHVISPANASWSFTAGTDTITQNHVITAQDASWSFSAGATTISQESTVSTNSGSWSFSAGVTTITQNHVVATQNVGWSFTAGTDTISQNHVIAPQDASWSFTAGNATMGVSLGTNAASWSFSAGTTTINQNHIVATNGASWGFSASADTITQNHVVVTGNASWTFTAGATTVDTSAVLQPTTPSWTFTADQATINQNHVLSPQNASWGFSAAATAIVRNYLIATQNASWTLTADNATVLFYDPPHSSWTPGAVIGADWTPESSPAVGNWSKETVSSGGWSKQTVGASSWRR